jgi:RNA polymerase sigma-70 factor, ECF subfamily
VTSAEECPCGSFCRRPPVCHGKQTFYFGNLGQLSGVYVNRNCFLFWGQNWRQAGKRFVVGSAGRKSYNTGCAVRVMAGAATLGDLASAIGAREQEAAIVAELKAGSEEAYAWLIGEFHQPIYGLVYRILTDPADAADTTQEVFLKVYRGMKHFHGESSLKTWIYRIAVHEASNRRRWWFRHKAHETSIEPLDNEAQGSSLAAKETLVDERESPFDNMAHEEVRIRVEQELRKVPEPYRSTLILRDLEEMSYEEIAEITQVSLGTVKSRLTRGREALKKRLTGYIREVGTELGLRTPEESERCRSPRIVDGEELEVTS